MWRYALPGFSNLWLILIKATPLLFLLGIQDIIYYADPRENGDPALLDLSARGLEARLSSRWIFYLVLTMLSQLVFTRLERRFIMGMVINETTSGRV